MKKYTEEEIKKMYNEFLDEIGRAGIEDYSYLFEKAEPDAYEIGFNDFVAEKRYIN